MKNGKKLRLLGRMAWKASPAYVLLLCFSTLGNGLQILCNVILPGFLIDELTGMTRPERLCLYGGLIVGSNLLFAWLNQFWKKCMSVQNVYVGEKMEQLLGERIMQLPYRMLEDPYYLDLKERASFALINQTAIMSLISQTAEVLKNGITLIGLFGVLLTLSPVLVLILLLLVGVMLLLQKHFNVEQKKIFDAILPVNRRYGYYVNLAFSGELQKDIRLYNMSKMLGDRITEYNRQISEQFDAFYKKSGFYMGMYSVINDLQAAVSYGYVGLRVITDWWGGRIGLGSFTVYVNAAVQFSRSITAFGKSVIEMGKILGYLDPFAELMELPTEEEPQACKELNGPVESICFEHVDFTYPGSVCQVLQDISFSVSKGEKISVVGLNGAGKSTLIKLLCRLYSPDAGRILVNGTDIREYRYASYIRQLAAVFQDYKLINVSIAENISCRFWGEESSGAADDGAADYRGAADDGGAGSREAGSKAAGSRFLRPVPDSIAQKEQSDSQKELSGSQKEQSDSQKERLDGLMEQVGLSEKLKQLPKGIYTLLGKEYDEKGTKLSGGQEQKIAIARALYKDASLIILDEPTSALDPLAEAEIYENFHELSGGKTAFYISHRMSSSIFCDKILVIDGGRAVDFDSHENLMKKTDSLYYKLFMSQAQNYETATS